MRVVVAGNTGLAGRAISRKYLSLGYEVYGINRSIVDLLELRSTIDFLLAHKPNIVVDAAAIVGGIGANASFPVNFLTDNLRIQNNLMEASYLAAVERFIFLGSSCIYPKLANQPIEENALLTGHLESSNSAYAIAKIAGLELVKSYRKQYGMSWISLMPTNLYGPNDNFNLETAHVLPALIRRFVDAQEQNTAQVTLWGSGNPLREFLHVDDLANAVVLAGNVYDDPMHLNVGSGEEISIKELASKIALDVGYGGEIVWDQSKLDGTPRKILDSRRMIALGWTPEISLDSGIASTVSWYKNASKIGGVRK
jgi:GDP-L-fucose synthase